MKGFRLSRSSGWARHSFKLETMIGATEFTRASLPGAVERPLWEVQRSDGKGLLDALGLGTHLVEPDPFETFLPVHPYVFRLLCNLGHDSP